ncbi:MAG: sigma-54-dependent Fis family transcriptional regulator [Gemmatimonadales bacterium]|nr:sigma-54-dependent Fis family transcriptional regulator [Gemmatimonadales bacterium]
MTDSILLIDDDIAVLRAVGAFFEKKGWDVFSELTGESGMNTFERTFPDVVLVDLDLPGIHGLDVLEQLRSRDTGVIVLTGDGDIPSAVHAMQLGAENYIVKPVDMAHLLAAAERAAEKGRLRRVNRTLIGQSSATSDGLEGLGMSPFMREVARQVSLVARSDRTPALIEGESGTGKRFVARLIHDLSPRSQAPFIELACGTGDAETIEAELFGREPGPGNGPRKPALVELADGGSLFLDEIGDLPQNLQLRLLNVIESRAFRRAGGSREIPVDVRMIAAATGRLQSAVDEGRFRDDLHARLGVMPVIMPPLRERTRDDMLALIRRLLRELAQTLPGAPNRLSDEALERLLAHSWPGNVREMRNVLERALLLSRGQEQVAGEHLPGELRAKTGPFDRRHNPLTMEEVERMHIERTLKHHRGNRTRSAEELGISRATLIAKIKRYAIPL